VLQEHDIQGPDFWLACTTVSAQFRSIAEKQYIRGDQTIPLAERQLAYKAKWEGGVGETLDYTCISERGCIMSDIELNQPRRRPGLSPNIRLPQHLHLPRPLPPPRPLYRPPHPPYLKLLPPSRLAPIRPISNRSLSSVSMVCARMSWTGPIRRFSTICGRLELITLPPKRCCPA